MFEILIIRHGDPDYENDCLTEKGKKDVRLLAKRLKDRRIDEIFASPMGRARQTAEATAEIKGLEITTLDFLHEFIGKIKYPDGDTEFPWHINGDFYSANFEKLTTPDFYKNEEFFDEEFRTRFENTVSGLDTFLENYGFEKTVGGYKNENAPDKTVAFFCHGGIGVLLMSLLCSLPVMKAWPHFFLNTSSVTEIDFVKSGSVFYPVCTLFGDDTHLSSSNKNFIAVN